jgi:hypothetical protein
LLEGMAVRPNVRVIGSCAQTRAEAVNVLQGFPGLDVVEVESTGFPGVLADTVLDAIGRRAGTVRAGFDFLSA